MASIFRLSMSKPMTGKPFSPNVSASGRPTYPNPQMPTTASFARMRSSSVGSLTWSISPPRSGQASHRSGFAQKEHGGEQTSGSGAGRVDPDAARGLLLGVTGRDVAVPDADVPGKRRAESEQRLAGNLHASLQVVPEGQPASLQRGEAFLLPGGGAALDHALMGHVPARLEQVLTAPAQLVDERRAIRSQGGDASMDDAAALVPAVLARREVESVASLHRGDARARRVGKRKQPPRDDAVLLEPIDLDGIVGRGAAACVPFLRVARVDVGAAVDQHVEGAEAQLDGVLVVVRMAARAALPVRSGAQAHPGVSRAEDRHSGIGQHGAVAAGLGDEPLRGRDPGPLRRGRIRDERRIERRSGRKRQSAAGVEIADLRHLTRRLEHRGEAPEEPANGTLDAIGRRQPCGPRRQHRGKEHLRAEAVVSRRRLEVRSVGPALPRDLFPQPGRERVEPAPQPGKERAHDDQANQVGRVVVGADRTGLFQMTRDPGAVLLEEIRQEWSVDSVPDQTLRQRYGHRPKADFHRAGPLHAEACGIGVPEMADGLPPGLGPGGVARERERLRETPELRKATDLPHHLGVRAPLEEVDALSRNRRVVLDAWRERIAVIVDPRPAALPLTEQRQLPAQCRLRLAQDRGAVQTGRRAKHRGRRSHLRRHRPRGPVEEERPPAQEGPAGAHRQRAGNLARRNRLREIAVVRDIHHAAFLRATSAAATISCISATRASQPSLLICAARTSLGPAPAAMAAAISRTTWSASLPMRHTESRSTSGIGVDTTGSPAARYSRTLSGLEARVSSFTLKGISATSNAFAYRGRSAYRLRPSTRMFCAPSSGLMSVAQFPRRTTVPPEKASATWRMSCKSTQSAIRPQKPMTGPGAPFRSSGMGVAGSNAFAKCSRSTPCCTR